MDIAEISPEMAKISPDLKNLAGKCSLSQSIQVSSGFGEKIRDWIDGIQFLEN